ncbi:hypothetical protein B6A27_15770 [Anoxybacillus sp. UARK-01]|nr:hypothetical protein B6A27_15770 [Anoxybacillus sp. UARK-01]
MEKAGKNDLCPCGSGKKYQKCCGKQREVISMNEFIMQEVMQVQRDLLHYALTKHKKELGEFIARRTNHLLDDEWDELFVFYTTLWAIFCQPLVNRKTIIEHYIQTCASQIKSPTIRKLLHTWGREFPSFVRVIERESLSFVIAEDIFTQKQKRIAFDKPEIKEGHLLIGTLVSSGPAYSFFISCLEIERHVAETVIELLQEMFDEKKDVSVREFVTLSFPELLYECFLQLSSKYLSIESLEWEQPVYEQVAYVLQERMEEIHGNGPWIYVAIVLWKVYCDLERPFIQKPELYAAAIHYLTLVIVIPYQAATQKEIAKCYRISSRSMAIKYREMEESMAEFIAQIYKKIDHFEEGRILTPEFIPHSQITTEPNRHNIRRLIQKPNDSAAQEGHLFVQSMLTNKKSESLREQAQELLDQAFHEVNPKRRKELVHQALRLYPNSAAAYNILGDEATTLKEAVTYYQKGMEAGEKELGKSFFRDYKGHFWMITETRSYMRAKEKYAQALWLLGEKEKAIKQYEQLLQLDFNDNQGTRYVLLPAYLETEKYEKAEELIEQYDEPTAFISYNRLLLAYLRYGLHEEMEELLEQAWQTNEYVMDYVLKKKRPPTNSPSFYSLGDENEAVIYAKEHLAFWQKERELLGWLQAMAPSFKTKW